MADDTPYTRTLARAAELVGGEQPLADALGVPLDQLRSWMRGEETPPVPIFATALDIVARGHGPR